MSNDVPTTVAQHTVLLLDCSTSMRSRLEDLIAGANEVVDPLRAVPGALVSVVYFNGTVLAVHWRVEAQDLPRFSEFNIPIDSGTSLYNAITSTAERLLDELAAAHGENNCDAQVLIITDGQDSCSQFTRMHARLAIGRLREAGVRLCFLSGVPGLASDLGCQREETIEFNPRTFRGGMRQATIMINQGKLAEALQIAEAEKRAEAEKSAEATRKTEVANMAVVSPIRPTKQRPQRPWWRFWRR